MNERGNGYKIENVVFSGKFETHDGIDISGLSTRMEHAIIRDNFPALICKTASGNGKTMLLFKSGKFVATGTSTIAAGREFIDAMKLTLKQNGIDILSDEYKVVNVVATGNLESIVDLDKFITTMENCQYEPEVFPGLIYRPEINKAPVFLIFKVGKFVCIGLDNEERIGASIHEMKRVLAINDLFVNRVHANT
jgi:transcription initiation factor TFIID TATA-box-binding protein